MKRRIKLILLFIIFIILLNTTSCTKNGYSYTNEGLKYESYFGSSLYRDSYKVQSLKEETIFDVDSVEIDVWLGYMVTEGLFEELQNGNRTLSDPYHIPNEKYVALGLYLFFNTEDSNRLIKYLEVDDYKNINDMYLVKQYDWEYIHNKDRVLTYKDKFSVFGYREIYRYCEKVIIPSFVFLEKSYMKYTFESKEINIYIHITDISQNTETGKYILRSTEKESGKKITFKILDNNQVERIS